MGELNIDLGKPTYSSSCMISLHNPTTDTPHNKCSVSVPQNLLCIQVNLMMKCSTVPVMLLVEQVKCST